MMTFGSFNYAFKTGILSVSQRLGVIILIPKKTRTEARLKISGQLKSRCLILITKFWQNELQRG